MDTNKPIRLAASEVAFWLILLAAIYAPVFLSRILPFRDYASNL